MARTSQTPSGPPDSGRADARGPATRAPGRPAKFGTFGGVFTPCTLTILGVIMFLRFGQVVGQAGIFQVLGILLLAKGITTLTAFSLSAIATNTRVRAGGAYYVISRSLGVEFGGAIGVVFFLAQAVSVSMYVVGFTEAFLNAFPGVGLGPRAFGTVVNGLVFACVYIGAGWTIRIQYGILGLLALSLVSFYAGALPALSGASLRASLAPSYLPGESFFTMFALFFPAVTGIMAGANLSGDLADPGRAIPRGTLGAIAATAAVYLSLALLLAASRPQEALIADPFILNEIAYVPALITAGVFAATLSSALGSMMGAPRILQAFARDRIIARIAPFARGSGPSNEPRRATIVTFAIAQAGILLGDLDAIAPVITMFFMITYGTLNLACFYESYTNNPSYRPRFRLSHWSMALLGAVGCGAAMLLIAPAWAVAACLVMLALHRYLGRADIRTRWGDVASGVAYERARRALLKLEDERYHPKNWRPTILALSGAGWQRFHLAEYGYWLTAGRGVLTLGQIISGDVEDRVERRRAEEKKLRQFIREQELEAFPAVVVEADFLEGMKALLQCHGIGGVRPNTVLLGWSRDRAQTEAFGTTLRLARDLQRSLLVVACDEEKARWETPEGQIDVWWDGPEHGALMLILAHLLVQSSAWRNRPVRILEVVPAGSERSKASRQLAKRVEAARIDAEVEVLVAQDGDAARRERSAQAAVVLIGFEPPEEGEEREFAARTEARIEGLRNVILVSNAGDVALEA